MLYTTVIPRTPSAGHAFAALEGARYLSLVTYRRSGDPVATPVWFAAHEGILYVHTLGGKVKRIRHTPSVSLAPCTMGGRVTGPTVAGLARVVEDRAEAAAAEVALAAKYGIIRRIYYAAQRLRRTMSRRPVTGADPQVYLAIEPAEMDRRMGS
jgi:uncharacterized protein